MQVKSCDTILRSMSLEAVSLLGVIESISSRNNTHGEWAWEKNDRFRLQFTFILFMRSIIYRFSQALKWSSHFFSRTSQGDNALPRPGLEPGLSDSEPSAPTTGLLDKAVALALACLQYSWPRMLKAAPCMVVRSYNQIFSAWWVTTILYFV